MADLLEVYGGQSVSDAKGWFEVSGLNEGLYRLEIRKTGYAMEIIAPLSVGSSADGQALEVLLDKESRITGKITGPSGEPVAGAVLVLCNGRGQPMLLAGTSRAPESDASGCYVIQAVKAGTYRVLAEAKGLARALSPAVSVPKDGAVEQDFSLGKEARIRVSVLAAGAPAEGADVTLLDSAGAEVIDWTARKSMIQGMAPQATDKEGKYTLVRLAAGTYTVKVQISDGRTKSAACTVAAGGETALALEFD